MDEPLCLNCPFCDEPPEFVVGGTQAFCGNNSCTLLMWNPTVSLDDNLMDAGVVRWEPTEGGTDG
jgi:hypothetical protein